MTRIGLLRFTIISALFCANLVQPFNTNIHAFFFSWKKSTISPTNSLDRRHNNREQDSLFPGLRCSSIDREALSIAKKSLENKNSKDHSNSDAAERKQRFVHPQVYKMFHRAQYLIRQGNSTVAQKLLVRCLQLNPYDSHSWLALGRLEAKLGNALRAREVFVEGISRCPDNVHILHAWGLMEQVSSTVFCNIYFCVLLY